MNFIKSEREDILRNSNNATENVKYYLDILIKNKITKINEITFDQPYSGDLDLSYLEENFTNIKKIVFESGKITSIRNIPKNIEILDIRDNLLLEFVDIPKSMIELNISGNYFESFDFSKTPNLKIFIANNNKIQNLFYFHENIQTLQLNSNNLAILDFKKATGLKEIHLMNNPIYKLYNLPENVELKSSNSNIIIEKLDVSSLETTNESDNETEEEINKEETNKELNYLESIDEFFKLKNKYEKDYKKTLRDIYLKYKYVSRKSKSFIQNQLSSIKPKCIKCGRPVGTIFSIKENRFSAVCGDRVKPCRLHIDIFRGFTRLVDSNLYFFKKTIVETESDIISEKMENILNYTADEESLKTAKETLENYNFFQKGFKEALDKYNEAYDNEEKNENIQKKISEINQKRLEIYELLNEYERNTNNKSLIKRSVEIYVNELVPVIESLRRTKYGNIEVFIKVYNENKRNEKSETYLLQSEASVSELEINYGEKPAVKKFIV